MKKKAITAVLILALLSATMLIYAFEQTDYKVTWGGDPLELDEPFFLQDDKLYVPLRSFGEAAGIPVNWDEETNTAELDIYHKKVPVSDRTPYREEGVIPDEETALTVGKAILEKYAGRPMEYETEDKIYYLEVEFLEQSNAWQITQTFKYKKEGGWNVGDYFYAPMVRLNKSSGEVVFLNTYSMYAE